MSRRAEEGGPGPQKPSAMSFRQALLFVVYYTVFQFIVVAIAGPVLHHFLGLDVTWTDLLLALVLLTCCGPIFVGLVYWSRASRDRPWAFTIRSGLSMCAMVVLYASAVTLSARRLGLSLISSAALPAYMATVLVRIPGHGDGDSESIVMVVPG